MGYHGLGLQRWIFTMKPRKFLGKRSKPDGGGGETGVKRDIHDYYHLKKNNLENLNKKVYSESYKKSLNKSLEEENKKQTILKILSLIITVVAVFLLFWYFNSKFAWF